MDEEDFPLITDYVYYYSEGLVPGAEGLNALSPKERSKIVMACKVFSKTIAPEKKTVFTETKFLEKPVQAIPGVFTWAARFDCDNLDPELKRKNMKEFVDFCKTLSLAVPRFVWRVMWGNFANQHLFYINGQEYFMADTISHNSLVLADSPVHDSKGHVQSLFLRDWLERVSKPITVTTEGW